MSQSRRFRQLRRELLRLRRHFLPSKWEPTGNYSERQFDHALAYRVFAHAEIEAYIEDVLLDVVEEKYERWKNAKKPSYVMTCLVIASQSSWLDVEGRDLGVSPIAPPKLGRDEDSVNQLLEKIVAQYRKIIEENNGIKKQDLKRLIMAVGISIADLDATWLNTMNSLAGKRGFVAHVSRLAITNLPDPKSEEQMVNDILTGLRSFDDLVTQVKKKT